VKTALAVLAVAPLLAAQIPRIGEIDFYGLRKISPEKVQDAIKVQAGDRLPASKGDLEEALAEIPGIVQARVEAVCCQGPDAILFVGVQERDAPYLALHSAPSGDAVLPPSLVTDYHDYLAAVQRAAARGDAAEDLSAGHSAISDPQAAKYQRQFASFAAQNLKLLRTVLRSGSVPEQRAIAAAVIGYAPDKKAVVDDLQFAIQDPDEAVRANAMHALAAIAVLARKQPSLGIRIPATWFVEVLHSLVLSDRMEAIRALTILTDRDNQDALDLMRQRALPDLVEMARWKTLRYALPPFVLVGRVAGSPDDQIQQYWKTGDRESVIRKALGTVPGGQKH
jgi:HEAT repeat protein